MTFLELLKDLGIFGIIVGVLGWVTKELGKYLLNKNIKFHQLSLDQQLEKYKSELDIINEKAFKLHDKRLEKIHNLYELLTDFYINVDNLTHMKNVTGLSDEEINEQKINEVKKTYESGYQFSMFYEKNKLYFDLETCELIQEILRILKECQYDLTIQYQWMNISIDMQMDFFSKAKDKIQNKIPELKEKLERKFRSIMGVE